ncbi:conserved hypothetical protein [Mesorhizobium sp. ORS 3324]|nr:conserved hypothetical protein [Mesorhizobium sp. ORS 3324]
MAGSVDVFELAKDSSGVIAARVLFSGPVNGISEEVTAAAALKLADGLHVLTYERESGVASLFAVSDAPPFLSARSKLTLPQQLDEIEPFVLGNRLHLLCYEQAKGNFTFYELGDTGALSRPYVFRRTHEPGTTSAFSMVKPFAVEPGGRIAFIGYNGATGAVASYTLSVRSTSPADTPPLFALVQWAHLWAKGWTRFAFFTFGLANFFLKTNPVYPNVNIDRILDDLSQGTIEVTSQMQDQLPEAMSLKLVQPLQFAHGEPYFVSYRDGGVLAFYRIWANCGGWDQMGTAKTQTQARLVMPVGDEISRYLVVI